MQEIADDLRRLLAVSPELNVSYKQTEEDGELELNFWIYFNSLE